MFEKSYGPKWTRQGWMAVFTIVIGLAMFALRQTKADDITGTVSKVSPLTSKMALPHIPMRMPASARRPPI